MPNRFLFKKAGTSDMKNLGSAVSTRYNTTSNMPAMLDVDGSTVRNLVAAAVPQTLAAGSQTMTAAMIGKTVHATEAGVQTFTLPTAATHPGARFTFVCGNAGGEILITPQAADILSIKGLVDHSTSVVPAAGTGVKNTAGSNVLGDYLTVESDGVLTWHEVSGHGIWASQ